MNDENKINIATIAFLTLCLVSVGCKKSDFDNNFNDPEKSTITSVNALFTGMLYNTNNTSSNPTLPRYFNLYTFQVPMLGLYTQTRGYEPNTKLYQQAVAYTKSRWDYYYTSYLASYRELEKKYNSSTQVQKAGYKLIMAAAKIFLYDQTAQMVDMWGDIPFSEAGALNATGKFSLGKYDMGKDLYSEMLDSLGSVAQYLKTADNTVEDLYKTIFAKADVLNKGDIAKWQKYCSSLMLRLAMRISYEDEAKAKAVVQKVLGDPTTYPLVDNVSENIQFVADAQPLNALVSQHESGIRGGMGGTLAPGYMVEQLMKPSGDPRLQVFFSKNKNGDYQGVPTGWTASRISDSATNNFFSRYDSTTFVENDLFPGIILTAAEVSFYKAEAKERWNIGSTSAKDNYETGIKQSIEYYYYINNLFVNRDSWAGDKKTPPTATAINTFLQNALVAYTGAATHKLALISIQQWENFGLMQAAQGWAELRRTHLLPLTFYVDNSNPGIANPPTRLLYPSTESSLNAENYAAVKAKDNTTTKIFWDVK